VVAAQLHSANESMSHVLTLTGDVNLMNLASPDEPFRLVSPMLRQSDFVSAIWNAVYIARRADARTKPKASWPTRLWERR
jgi:hypothetical protein